MAYNILGIHPGHNSSIALISDGKLVYYLEEERLSRIKRDSVPFRTMVDICSKYKIDELAIGGTNDKLEHNKTPWMIMNYFVHLAKKYNKNVKISDFKLEHHLTHASIAFFNSGFKSSAVIVIDGAGSKRSYKDLPSTDLKEAIAYETETIYNVNYQEGFKCLYKNHGAETNERARFSNNGVGTDFIIDSTAGIAKTYEAVTKYLGWHPIEAGKTMGLGPYGKQNPNIPPLFKNGKGNRDLFITRYPAEAILDYINNPLFLRSRPPKEFHKDPSKLLEIEADLAWQVQNDTQEEVAKLIEKTINLTGQNKICIVGGYGLNCVANYYLKKKFPDIEIYHEPIAHDGGTSIGAARYCWFEYSKNQHIEKQTSIYLGPKYSKKKLLKTIKSYKNMFKQYKVNYFDIAKLISERNIVTIFQGRSEAGPRALGNRSILYDPTDPNGKDFVNKVKNREWFRPFAGTVLLEKAHEYFDMAGLEESPFMMYAMDVWPNKQEQIQAITHVDGTCRIQTVTEKQNPHYYKLIQEFEKITGVPILFNTSFNLAGDPLVETIEDALETLLKSELKYLYLPELEMLLEKK